jgi:fructokinase
MKPLLGAVEAGGTKFVCAVGTGPDDLRDEVRFPTTTPAETLGRALDYFRKAQVQHGPLAALGIGSFGPVDLDRASPTWGSVTSTPKPHWAQTPVATLFASEFGIPVGWDTDVNGAALGEHLWGAGQGLDSLVYLTIGTGIGAGVLVGGQLVHGLVHPEAGHVLLPRDPKADPFPGVCPFHGDCWEGLAAGPAIAKRWGTEGSSLGPEHPAWALEARYIALGLQGLLGALSPQRFILGGGVMAQPQLFPLVRRELLRLNNGYIRHPSLTPGGIDRYVVPPALGNQAGILGALALADRALTAR